MTTLTTSSSSGVGDALDVRRPRRRGPRASGSWLAALPLHAFVALAFGLPAVAMVNGAFTVNGSYGLGNLDQSVHGAYRTALLGSLKLAATTAGIGSVLGLLVA